MSRKRIIVILLVALLVIAAGAYAYATNLDIALWHWFVRGRAE